LEGLYDAMAMGICLGCDEDIRFPGRPRLGQMVTCHRCGAHLQVIDVNPLELDWMFDEEDLEDDELENEEEFEEEMAEHLGGDEQEEL
jgi:lysine biosynthesis protein LysW